MPRRTKISRLILLLSRRHRYPYLQSAVDPGLFDSKYDGVLICLDEIDRASDTLDLGTFLKTLIESLQRRECNHVMFGLAGLTEAREVLRDSHPSSLRMIDDLPLERLASKEATEVIERCLGRANERNSTATNIDLEAKTILAALSEGYPHFIQQYGYSAFACDADGLIDQTDVLRGAFGPGGALKAIGERYYREDFFERIQKDSYRQVLRIMADKLDAWVTKEAIRQRFTGTEKTLNNALQALRDRNIILSKDGERGIYRLQQKGFAIWIKTFQDHQQKLPLQDQSLGAEPTEIQAEIDR